MQTFSLETRSARENHRLEKMRAATVSVVIPTFNRREKIAPTLDSVLNQTRVPLEIVVVDDGSTDDTASWIETNYAGKVRLMRQQNGGVARARNRGWRVAKGEWIAFLDHDDVFHPEKLETLAPFLNADSDVVVSRWREVRQGEVERESPVVATRDAFGWLLGWNNPLVSASVPLVRRAALERVGGFDARCVPADDWDLWLRLARTSRFCFCDDILTDYVLHANQQRLDERRMFRAVRRALARHPAQLTKRPLLLWWLVWSGAFVLSLAAYERAKRGEAGAWIEAVRAHPLSLLSPQWLALGLKMLRERLGNNSLR